MCIKFATKNVPQNPHQKIIPKNYTATKLEINSASLVPIASCGATQFFAKVVIQIESMLVNNR